jgi:bifunctional DNA-binding transcriptional regulator/antitoxin component of YhaV-PrlF toxin-antitoxin module
MGGTYGVTIPANARKVLGWQPGEHTIMEILGGPGNYTLVMRIVTRDMILDRRKFDAARPGKAVEDA